MSPTLLRASTLASIACVGLFSASASATVTTYVDVATFDDASKTSIVVTFEEREWTVAVSHEFFGSIASGGITFVPIASPPVLPPNLFVAPPTQTNFCCALSSRTLTSSGDEDIDLVFAAPPRAVGFVSYSNGGQPIVYTITFVGGGQQTIISPQPANTKGFIGFTSGEPIAKLNWTSDIGALVNTGIDDVRIGTVSCPADLDGDGIVGAADLAILLGAWAGGGIGDLDGSGVVGGADLAILLGAWGPCP